MAKIVGRQSSLDRAIREIEAQSARDRDEFTAKEFIEQARQRGITITSHAARHRLTVMVENGDLSVRKHIVGGRNVNLYKWVKK